MKALKIPTKDKLGAIMVETEIHGMAGERMICPEFYLNSGEPIEWKYLKRKLDEQTIEEIEEILSAIEDTNLSNAISFVI